ncbi:rCG42216, isoform CRA_a [Rattus norvegicus]|uniref:RCG42216, isoform CRA_a n=1 Tax=Rattus norvegicus TaxID=10116 RepID=A6K055_RAT|nr:rCG42216, isoform CRA_a [Rattus norvegicus]
MYFIFKVTAITHGPILLAYCFLCYVKRSADRAEQSRAERKACAVVFTQKSEHRQRHLSCKL